MFVRLLLAALLLVPGSRLFAQGTEFEIPSSRSLSFDVSSMNGLRVHGSARGVQGLDYSAGASVTTPGDEPILHRVILDRTHNTFFGYDLTFWRDPATRYVHVHFARLSDTRGFGFDRDAFTAAKMTLPLDSIVPLDTGYDVPLETAADGSVMLHDTLRFSVVQ